jgi:nucleotide-binding universal stress UspA family protein
MKNILLLVHDDAGQTSRLQAAIDLTRALDGHLTCLDVVMMPALASDPYGASAAGVLLEDEYAREAVNRERVEEHLFGEDIAWDLASATGDLAPCLEEAARLADVIVVNRKVDSFAPPALSRLAGELIVKSGKPVLAVPEMATGFAASGRAIIAWNGSEASTAALQAAVPLLQRTTCVIIIEIENNAGESSARDAATYLSRHGIHALIRFERPQGRSTSDILLSEIRDRRADYLVMGGYGHRRIAQALFGGVTRTMLERSPVPIFLAHG